MREANPENSILQDYRIEGEKRFQKIVDTAMRFVPDAWN